MTKPYAVDVDDRLGYRTEWYCKPPGMHQSFRALREKWNHDYTVRRIYVWEAL